MYEHQRNETYDALLTPTPMKLTHLRKECEEPHGGSPTRSCLMFGDNVQAPQPFPGDLKHEILRYCCTRYAFRYEGKTTVKPYTSRDTEYINLYLDYPWCHLQTYSGGHRRLYEKRKEKNGQQGGTCGRVFRKFERALCSQHAGTPSRFCHRNKSHISCHLYYRQVASKMVWKTRYPRGVQTVLNWTVAC